MNINERRLNGRDVLAKTFPAKTKKGYDPIDVDAYLELVASQVDLLHGDILRAGESASEASVAPVGTVAEPVADEGIDVAGLQSELDAARAERDALQARLEEELAAAEMLKAENQQLRTQLTSIAPPPPAPAGAQPQEIVATEAVEVAQPEDVTAVVAAAGNNMPVAAAGNNMAVAAAGNDMAVVDERAHQESYDLVLRAAQRSAEEAISAAHVRADEIVADANLTASRIAQESDRKAYEAANRAQGELAVISSEIESQRAELTEIDTLAAQRRSELRSLGETIIRWVNQATDSEVVDLRGAEDAETDTAPANDTLS